MIDDGCDADGSGGGGQRQRQRRVVSAVLRSFGVVVARDAMYERKRAVVSGRANSGFWVFFFSVADHARASVVGICLREGEGEGEGWRCTLLIESSFYVCF